MKTSKRYARIFGVPLFSALLVFVLGGFVPYTTIFDSNGNSTVEGPFSSLVPTSSDNFLSILEIISYHLGFGSAGTLLLAGVPLGLSLVAALFLLFGSGSRILCLRPFRYLVVGAYCTTPLLAAAIVGMFLYAVLYRAPIVA